MNGLYLQGGGAKGAFQAGAVYGLLKKGISFQVIAGTSIGAVNGYYIYTGNEDALKKLYLNTEPGDQIADIRIKDTVPNDILINGLEKLPDNNTAHPDFYVNYVMVKEHQLYQYYQNIRELPKKEQLERIKYSSLLPCTIPGDKESISFPELMESYHSGTMRDDFGEKMAAGQYDGRYLDGGLINNMFLEPFVQNKVDRLYIISIENDFIIPDYITKIYDKRDLCLIRRDIPFSHGDSMRFEKEFLTGLFKEGCDKVQTIQ